MKYFSKFALLFVFAAIIISSFFFIGDDQVKSYTTDFIYELITTGEVAQLTEEENDQLHLFIESFQAQNLPYPVIEGVKIPYFDVFTPATENEGYMQYISVKYEPVDGSSFDTFIHFEYIKNKSMQHIYFGKIVVRSYNAEFSEIQLVEIKPMEKQ